MELNSNNTSVGCYRSDNLNELFAALAKAQSEMEMAYPKSSNPFFKSKYADLQEIVRASRPYLTKNGLCVMQPVLPHGDGHHVLVTVLGHTSGQWIESRMRIVPPKADVQSLGSYMTYLQRYSYKSLIMNVTCDEEDDDGNLAVQHHHKKYTNNLLTDNQLAKLEEIIGENVTLRSTILKTYKITDIRQLTSDQASIFIDKLMN